MFDKMKQLMEMKKQADQIKRELDGTQIESTDVRGIKIVVNGSLEVRSIEIEESLLTAANKKNLERDLTRAMNAAVRKAQTIAASKMRDMMPGFPGLS